MATAWLSNLLSSSSAIKCFHGTVGLIEPFNPSVDADTALAALLTIDLPSEVKYPGIVHLSLSHGSWALETCIEHNIEFCALTRNPILAADSQFQGRLETDDSTNNVLRDRLVEIAQSVPALINVVDESSWTDILFFRCVYSVIAHLLDLEVNGHPAFKFEDYTTDYGEVVKIVQAITRGQLSDDPEIRQAFANNEKINRHRKRISTSEETWKISWSQKQREIFYQIWKFGLKDYQRKKTFYPEVDSLFSDYF